MNFFFIDQMTVEPVLAASQRHALIGSGLNWPDKTSVVAGVGVSGEISMFSRKGLSAYLSVSLKRAVFVVYDWAINSKSCWELVNSEIKDTEFCQGKYKSVGPKSTILIKPRSCKLGIRADFGHPISAKLELPRSHSSNIDCLPFLVCQVISVDAFGRQRLEGYSCIKIPSAHSIQQDLVLYAPKTNWREKLVGVFCPLTSRLRTLDLIGEGDCIDARLAKEAGLVETSGMLHVKLQVMHTLRGRVSVDPSPPLSPGALSRRFSSPKISVDRTQFNRPPRTDIPLPTLPPDESARARRRSRASVIGTSPDPSSVFPN